MSGPLDPTDGPDELDDDLDADELDGDGDPGSFAFVPGPDGRPSVGFAEPVAATLRHLLDQVLEMIDGRRQESPPPSDDPLAAVVGMGGPAELPDDPALARLFPDAYTDDAESAGDFRRYTEQGLQERKAAAIRTALDTLDRPRPVPLDEPEALAWLGALNDLRLVLGVRLGVTGDEDGRVWVDDPDEDLYLVFEWLGGLQASLLDLLP